MRSWELPVALRAYGIADGNRRKGHPGNAGGCCAPFHDRLYTN
ncbi:hypothetical protein T261_8110 [Streptomyces lydicus]|nr:hypothetical protein T261_8110 [Streptomyces lydicus]